MPESFKNTACRLKKMLKVLEEGEHRMIVEFENSTIARLLEAELWQNSHITISGIKTKHPMVGKPTLVIETDAKESARAALEGAISRAQQAFAKLKKSIK